MAGQPNQIELIDTVGTWDYVLFVIMLGATLGIGIFHAVKDWRQRRRNKKQPNANVTEENTKEYFAGGHKMNVFAISMSMIATYVHSNLILGYPAEIYYYGAQYWLYCVGQALGAILAIVIFVPVFYPLQMTSVNHYFMLRFDSLIVQWIGMFCSAVALLFLTGVTLFGPATALEAVTDIPDWGYIVLLSIITVFYTTLGGFKAVIWTDVFQSVVMVAGMIAIVAKGIHEVGDMSDIWDIYSDWDRDDFFDFTGDPTQRLTFWGLVCGVGLTFMGIYGSSQVGVQRYSSLSTRRKANISVLSVIPGSIFFTSLACLSGVVIFAYFAQEGCDPLFSRQIKNPNQIVPYFLMRVLNQPGVPGIFLAAMCAGALSTASSCLNSSAANIWEDFLEKVLPDKYKTDFWVNIISKLTVVFCGIVAMCLAFVVMGVGGTLTQAFGSFAAGMGGPVVGLFLMGLFNPWANWKGACVGTVIGMTFTLWVAIGSYTIGRQKSDLPLPRDTCPKPPVPANGTSPAGPPSDDWNITGIEHLYTLTFLWFKEAGSGITILIGTIVSLFTGPTDPATIHPCLLHPVVRWILRKTGKLMSDEESARSDPRTISEKELKGVGNAAYAESTPDVSKVANGFHGDSHTNGTDVFPQGTYSPYTSTSV